MVRAVMRPLAAHRSCAKTRIVHPDQVWAADITYITLATQDMYLAIVMDVFTLSIRGWHLGRSLGGKLTLTALRPALSDRQPSIHHSDQGVQYAAKAYAELLQAHGVAVRMTDAGAAWKNGYAERVIRTIKEEGVHLSDYQNYGDAYQQIGRFLADVYTHKRIHSSRLSGACRVRGRMDPWPSPAASLGARNAQIVSSSWGPVQGPHFGSRLIT